MARAGGILFSAFEPSGDALAAPLIAELIRREPDRPIFALGGPKMQAAGAQIIEHTTAHAAMLGDAVAQWRVHRDRLRRLQNWMADRELAAVVPTDSPAANWSICRMTRRLQPQARIVHLPAPQLWAWAPWRIGKMRRLSDHVLCILPFETQWFSTRGVPATFVGHPAFDAADSAPQTHEDLPVDGHPRLALLPGSRSAEVKRNWPTMVAACEQLSQRYARMRVAVAASDDARAEQIRSLCPDGELPERATMVLGNARAVLDWSDAALVVSGTATLECVARRTPLAMHYRVGRLAWALLGRWLIRTRTFALPNVLAESMDLPPVVPELVLTFGRVEPVVAAMAPLLTDEAARARQLEVFARIHEPFAQRVFAHAAADALIECLAR